MDPKKWDFPPGISLWEKENVAAKVGTCLPGRVFTQKPDNDGLTVGAGGITSWADA